MNANAVRGMSENFAKPMLTIVLHPLAAMVALAATWSVILSACAVRAGLAKCARMMSKSVMNPRVKIMLSASTCSRISSAPAHRELMVRDVK